VVSQKFVLEMSCHPERVIKHFHISLFSLQIECNCLAV
jgi:hypothetical protein